MRLLLTLVLACILPACKSTRHVENRKIQTAFSREVDSVIISQSVKRLLSVDCSAKIQMDSMTIKVRAPDGAETLFFAPHVTIGSEYHRLQAAVDTVDVTRVKVSVDTLNTRSAEISATEIKPARLFRGIERLVLLTILIVAFYWLVRHH